MNKAAYALKSLKTFPILTICDLGANWKEKKTGVMYIDDQTGAQWHI